jgi:hypothetical protein
MREDGVWFIRVKRKDAPGFTRWTLAPFNVRPLHAWYSGRHAHLPKWKRSDNVLRDCVKMPE